MALKFFIFNFANGWGHNSVMAECAQDVVKNYQKMNGINCPKIDEASIRQLDDDEIGPYWATFRTDDKSKWGKLPLKG